MIYFVIVYNFYAFTLCMCAYKYMQTLLVNVCEIHTKRKTTENSNLGIKNLYHGELGNMGIQN